MPSPHFFAWAGGGLQVVEFTLVDAATAALIARERMLPHTDRMYACDRLVHFMKQKCAAVSGREGIEVFSAKLKRRIACGLLLGHIVSHALYGNLEGAGLAADQTPGEDDR